MNVLLTRSELNAVEIEKSVHDDAAGAVVSFVGVTRNRHQGRAVLRLEYEAHETLALKMIEHMCEEAQQRFGLINIALHHRLGCVEIGAASVVIAVSSAHRGAAFDGCRHLIDTLKTTVPIWKKEFYADGSAPEWVGPDGKPVAL